MTDHDGAGASAPVSLEAMVRAWREPQGDTETLALLRTANKRLKETIMAAQDTPLVPTWVYPVAGGEGKIIDLEPGAKAPAGYAFSPAKPKPAKAKE